jgi:hypothetical protein
MSDLFHKEIPRAYVSRTRRFTQARAVRTASEPS